MVLMRDVDFGVCLLLFFLFFLSLGSVCGVGGDYIWRDIWESQYSNN